MNRQRHDLLKELETEGATSREANSMADLAELLPVVHQRTYRHAQTAQRSWLRFAAGSGVVTAALLLVVTFSLRSLPGEALYPVKEVAESAATAVSPSMHTAVMMDKSWEVAQLTGTHQSPELVHEALQSYNAQFQAVKGSHYPAWEYCEMELKKASAQSSGKVKQEIDASLKNVPTES